MTSPTPSPGSRSKHLDRFIERQLRAGEEPIAWSACYKGGLQTGVTDVLTNSGIVVVTNSRLVFYRAGILGETCESIPLSKISSIEKRTLFANRLVQFHTSHDSLSVNFSSKEGMVAVLKAVEAHLAQSEVTVQPSQQNPETPLDRLKKLGELMKQGVITETEFEEKKRKILGEI